LKPKAHKMIRKSLPDQTAKDKNSSTLMT